MSKTILITGATDGIGYETAKRLAEKGHSLILHGRSQRKTDAIVELCKGINGSISVEGIVADFSDLKQVKTMVTTLLAEVDHLDVLINNAGVYKAKETTTIDDIELRFAVNTYAPYILTKGLLPLMDEDGRLLNLSSAAQSSVDINALRKVKPMTHDEAYSQSKLAIMMWSLELAKESKPGPVIIVVNPKSFLGSKMVKEGYGMEGHNLSIGADLLVRLALDEAHGKKIGEYYDNDQERYAKPHPDALDEQLRRELIQAMDEVLIKL